MADVAEPSKVQSGPRGRISALLLVLGVVSVLAWLVAGRLDDGALSSVPPHRQRIVLVTVDTLRQDYLGIYGQSLPTSPFLDRWMAEAFRFDRSVTPVPRTTPALASLLSGQYPHTTKVRSLVDRVSPEVALLPEVLRRLGFQTLAVVSNNSLRPQRDLDRGFDVYDYADNLRDGLETNDSVFRHLRDVDPDRPLFLWVHYIDPHMPYIPPSDLFPFFDDPAYEGPYRRQFGQDVGNGNQCFPAEVPKPLMVHRNPLAPEVNRHVRRLYAGDVRAADRAVEDLFARLDKEIGPGWLQVVTADHGESLGELDYYYEHGDYVHDATTRVPLGIRLADGDPLRESGVSQQWVSLVDVVPTLLELLGAPKEALDEFEGRSLVPLLSGQPRKAGPVFAETGKAHFPSLVQGRVRFDVAGRPRAIYDGDWKLIWIPGVEGEGTYQLFHLSEDPGELNDVASYHPDVAARLRAELSRWLQGLDDRTAEPDEEDLRALRELGYVE